MSRTDSAGVPWEGRRFESNTNVADDGTAPADLMAAIASFRRGEIGAERVIDALREARLLIPLVARLGEAGMSDRGHTIDKNQELSIVTVLGPDGRTVLPAFSSVDAMRAWHPTARPIPAPAVRVALAADHEDTDVVVLDPTTASEFVIRRPALAALAAGEPWLPAYSDEQVVSAFGAVLAAEPNVASLIVLPGDPDARFAGPEVVVRLELVDGLDRDEVTALVARVTDAWSASELIAARVDSMRVQLARSPS